MTRLKKIGSKFVPVAAVVISLVFAGILVSMTGESPLAAYKALLQGAFGSLYSIKQTIRFATPLMLVALSFSICKRSGYFNIGQDAQIYMSALAATWVCLTWTSGPAWLRLIVAILAAIATGAVCSSIPAILKVLIDVDEVILAFMFNYIVGLFTSYALLYSPIADTNSSSAVSLPINPSLYVPEIGRTGMSVWLIVAVAAIVFYGLWMRVTVPGYRMRMTGLNRRFAAYGGIDTRKTMVMSALLGGAFSGLAAAGEILGIYHLYFDKFSPGLGFNGIAAALLGNHTPVGIALGSLFLGALQSGSVQMSVVTEVPAELVLVVQALVMFFATARRLGGGSRA